MVERECWPLQLANRVRLSDTGSARPVGWSSLSPCGTSGDRSWKTEPPGHGGEFLPAGCSGRCPTRREQQLVGSAAVGNGRVL